MENKETLEEAAERLYPISGPNSMWNSLQQDGFIEGAQWQQERMYSEEDLQYAFECATDLNPSFETFSAWFKQFKKK